MRLNSCKNSSEALRVLYLMKLLSVLESRRDFNNDED